jgi:metal-dependent HD superfamily phosphatase/phosphodiesterase
MMAEETVTIPKSVYEQLLKDSEWLSYLEAAGVDNWDGFDYAFEMREEARKEE